MVLLAGMEPFIKVACSCVHVTGELHRFAAFDLAAVVTELGDGDPLFVVPLGGLRMGSFGIVLEGFVATDIWAVLRNVIWEDEHCFECCGRLLRMIEHPHLYQKVLLRCGPTIGPRDVGMSIAEAGRITDEYWTD